VLGRPRRERAGPSPGVRGRRDSGQPLVLAHRPPSTRAAPALSLERSRSPACPGAIRHEASARAETRGA
jgi:hypothetical protein